MRHEDDCIVVAMHGDRVDRSNCQDVDEGPSADTQLVRNIEKLPSLPDDTLGTLQHDATSSQYVDLVQE